MLGFSCCVMIFCTPGAYCYTVPFPFLLRFILQPINKQLDEKPLEGRAHLESLEHRPSKGHTEVLRSWNCFSFGFPFIVLKRKLHLCLQRLFPRTFILFCFLKDNNWASVTIFGKLSLTMQPARLQQNIHILPSICSQEIKLK